MPFIMTYILASLFEKNVRQGIIGANNGGWDFITRPVSLIFILVGVVVLIIQTVLPAIKRSKAKKAQA